MKTIKAIIFDYGRVLSVDQDATAVNEMCRVVDLPQEVLLPSYYRFRREFDAGLLTAVEYWKKICDDCQVSCSKEMIQQLIQLDIQSWTVINHHMLDHVIGLDHHRVKRALLSNMPGEIAAYINTHCSWLGLFDEIIYSCRLKRCKPDKVVYRVCLNRMQMKPGDCLFIDDSYENIKSAGEVGLHTIQFKDYDQYRQELSDNYTII